MDASVCKFYIQGTCRDGWKCQFAHPADVEPPKEMNWATIASSPTAKKDTKEQKPTQNRPVPVATSSSPQQPKQLKPQSQPQPKTDAKPQSSSQQKNQPKSAAKATSKPQEKSKPETKPLPKPAPKAQSSYTKSQPNPQSSTHSSKPKPQRELSGVSQSQDCDFSRINANDLVPSQEMIQLSWDQWVPNAVIPCKFHLAGNCTKGTDCSYFHCPSGDEFESSQAIFSCGICHDDIIEPKQFALLSGCDHPFCLECAKKWRASDANKQISRSVHFECPVCRARSKMILPLPFYAKGEQKMMLMERYFQKLATIPCKFFNFGKSRCPFAPNCIYAHLTQSGAPAKDLIGRQAPGGRTADQIREDYLIEQRLLKQKLMDRINRIQERLGYQLAKRPQEEVAIDKKRGVRLVKYLDYNEVWEYKLDGPGKLRVEPSDKASLGYW